MVANWVGRIGELPGGDAHGSWHLSHDAPTPQVTSAGRLGITGYRRVKFDTDALLIAGRAGHRVWVLLYIRRRRIARPPD